MGREGAHHHPATRMKRQQILERFREGARGSILDRAGGHGNGVLIARHGFYPEIAGERSGVGGQALGRERAVIQAEFPRRARRAVLGVNGAGQLRIEEDRRRRGGLPSGGDDGPRLQRAEGLGPLFPALIQKLVRSRTRDKRESWRRIGPRSAPRFRPIPARARLHPRRRPDRSTHRRSRAGARTGRRAVPRHLLR